MGNKQWEAIWTNGRIATCDSNVNLIDQAAIAIDQGHITWVGAMSDLPASPEVLASKVHDLRGACVTPGFIDCHTHLVFAGNRAHEFELRLQGVSYEEIARRGGGIQSTVSATRAASENALFEQSVKRARLLQQSGVTTVEIKSGYGLDWETEAKMLRVAKKIENTLPLTVMRTFLGAHTVPIEYQGKSDLYVDLICDEMLPAIADQQLAEAVDVFCETIAFSLPQSRRIFDAADKYGLSVKCHSEQLSNSGSAELAAKYHALSVDHLEHLSYEGVKAIADTGTVAVLLPGAFYFLREKKYPPIDWLRDKRVPIAIASDCNPGTSPITSMLLVLNMACTIFRLTPEEALLGVTKHAAKALGIEHTHGTLTVGKAADFAVWDIDELAELAYFIGANPLRTLIKGGKQV